MKNEHHPLVKYWLFQLKQCICAVVLMSWCLKLKLAARMPDRLTSHYCLWIMDLVHGWNLFSWHCRNKNSAAVAPFLPTSPHRNLVSVYTLDLRKTVCRGRLTTLTNLQLGLLASDGWSNERWWSSSKQALLQSHPIIFEFKQGRTLRMTCNSGRQLEKVTVWWSRALSLLRVKPCHSSFRLDVSHLCN